MGVLERLGSRVVFCEMWQALSAGFRARSYQDTGCGDRR